MRIGSTRLGAAHTDAGHTDQRPGVHMASWAVATTEPARIRGLCGQPATEVQRGAGHWGRHCALTDVGQIMAELRRSAHILVVTPWSCLEPAPATLLIEPLEAAPHCTCDIVFQLL